MICPICSLYFQDVEQEAFRHHALLSHRSSAMMQAIASSGDARTSRRAEPAVADPHTGGKRADE